MQMASWVSYLPLETLCCIIVTAHEQIVTVVWTAEVLKTGCYVRMKKPTARRRGLISVLFAVSHYAWKELPQPQDFTAFGLSNVKPRFSTPS